MEVAGYGRQLKLKLARRQLNDPWLGLNLPPKHPNERAGNIAN